MSDEKTNVNRTYKEGQIDALEMFGRVCGREGACAECFVAENLSELNMTCQEYAALEPAKFLALLEEADKEEYTYADEFANRFPKAGIYKTLLGHLFCRKAMFEGYLDCEKGDNPEECVACWAEQYNGDVTMEQVETTDTSEDEVAATDSGNDFEVEDDEVIDLGY